MAVAEPPTYRESYSKQRWVPEKMDHPVIPHQRKETEGDGKAGVKPTWWAVL